MKSYVPTLFEENVSRNVAPWCSKCRNKIFKKRSRQLVVSCSAVVASVSAAQDHISHNSSHTHRKDATGQTCCRMFLFFHPPFHQPIETNSKRFIFVGHCHTVNAVNVGLIQCYAAHSSDSGNVCHVVSQLITKVIYQVKVLNIF